MESFDRSSTHVPFSPAVQIAGLAISVLLCFAAVTLGALATNVGLADWYETLQRPAGTPPSWVFGPVWTLLYLMMATAAWLVWRQRGLYAAAVPLAWYGVQLGLNVLWSVVFFGLQQPGWALAEIVVLWGAILTTLVQFWRRTPVAGALLVPYLAWVSYATWLNFGFWWLNR